MRLTPASLEGVWTVEYEPVRDERGSFTRVFDAAVFGAAGLAVAFPEHSETRNVRAGTVRGLHYQAAPFGEVKLVRVTRGAVYDVVVDVRPESPARGCWLGLELRADRPLALYVPDGFAHGYQTLTDDTELQYLISAPYRSEAARGVAYDSPALAIPWPQPVTSISERDRTLPRFAS